MTLDKKRKGNPNLDETDSDSAYLLNNSSLQNKHFTLKKQIKDHPGSAAANDALSVIGNQLVCRPAESGKGLVTAREGTPATPPSPI